MKYSEIKENNAKCTHELESGDVPRAQTKLAISTKGAAGGEGAKICRRPRDQSDTIAVCKGFT